MSISIKKIKVGHWFVISSIVMLFALSLWVTPPHENKDAHYPINLQGINNIVIQNNTEVKFDHTLHDKARLDVHNDQHNSSPNHKLPFSVDKGVLTITDESNYSSDNVLYLPLTANHLQFATDNSYSSNNISYASSADPKLAYPIIPSLEINIKDSNTITISNLQIQSLKIKQQCTPEKADNNCANTHISIQDKSNINKADITMQLGSIDFSEDNNRNYPAAVMMSNDKQRQHTFVDKTNISDATLNIGKDVLIRASANQFKHLTINVMP